MDWGYFCVGEWMDGRRKEGRKESEEVWKVGGNGIGWIINYVG